MRRELLSLLGRAATMVSGPVCPGLGRGLRPECEQMVPAPVSRGRPVPCSLSGQVCSFRSTLSSGLSFRKCVLLKMEP